MKKIHFSLATILTLSTFAMAGGSIDPVGPTIDPEPPIVVPEPSYQDSGFYLGLGYGFLKVERETLVPGNLNNTTWGTGDYDQIMLQAGYKINPYFALEGRYWLGLGDNAWAAIGDNSVQSVGEVDQWGFYVKPIYPITEALDVYALLGWSKVTYDITNAPSDANRDGFSWGVGAAYDFNQNWSMFADYSNVYDNETKNKKAWLVNDDMNVISVGFTYKF